MRRLRISLVAVYGIVSLLASGGLASANDSAAGIAASGLYLKEEKDISLEKEDLLISEDRIEVSYTFKNLAPKDITTEIAFPVPDYGFDVSDNTFYPMYDDFTVVVNGERVKYQEEVRAFVDGVECTEKLAGAGISAKSFGSTIHDPNKSRPDTEKEDVLEGLSDAQKQVLTENKLVSFAGNRAVPLWTVSRKYHWTQRFPAKRTVTIKHAYSPYKSFGYISDQPEFISSACLDALTADWLESLPWPKYYRQVDYLLTTISSGKRPIKSFRLVIDSRTENTRVATCFKETMARTSSTRREITLQNFVPDKDLRVYFLGR